MKKAGDVTVKIAWNVGKYCIRQVGQKVNMKYKTWQQKLGINSRWPLKAIVIKIKFYCSYTCPLYKVM